LLTAESPKQSASRCFCSHTVHAPEKPKLLSIIDPDWPDPEAFQRYERHQSLILHFHDIIDPILGHVPPEMEHMEAILSFGQRLRAESEGRQDGHLLIHCHMGIARSMAPMATLLGQANPQEDEDQIFTRVGQIGRRAWPNSVIISHAAALMGRGGRFVEALRRFYERRLAEGSDQEEPLRRAGRGPEVDLATRA
jgi:predicted protein tyrosine phosphatase